MRTNPSPGVKLTGFTIGVVAVFAAGFGVSRAVAPDALSEVSTGGGGGHSGDKSGAHGGGHGTPTTTAGEGGGHGGAHGGGQGGDDAGVHSGGNGGTPAASATVPGLAVADAGYRFVPESTVLASGPASPFRFRIDGPDAKPVQAYQQLHERELHLIVVRRDLTGFQHVHPTRAADGTWSIDLNLQQGGTWRAFADFAPTGGPAQLTLGVDLQVPGAFVPGSAPTAAAAADPSLAVAFERRDGDIDIAVRRDGAPVEPEPYLGARGHLVALRAGDLAYLHVHPQEGGAPAVRFAADLPTTGSYALFFDYQVSGTVRTAVSTMEVK